MRHSNMLVIGDLHEPFTLDGYRDFCVKMYKKHKCTDVMFIGDLIDNHFSSFHETDPDGHSAAAELEIASINIKRWYKAFPHARVTIGNHDRIPNRKAFNSGLSKRWIKDIGVILQTPAWEYKTSFIIDGVQYCHGEGKLAHTRMIHDMISTVQGHYHTDSKIVFQDGAQTRLWSMQVGCGFDKSTYAGQYAKHHKAQSHNVGIVEGNGRLPILEPYDYQ